MNFEYLVTRFLHDPEFAKRLASDPAGALREAGIEPTPEKVAAIKQIDSASIAKAAAVIGSAQAIPN